MSFLSALYDRCMKHSEKACLIKWRRELLQDVDGKVLEIGAGTGASLELYPVRDGMELFFSEPDTDMRLLLHRKIAALGRDKIRVLSCPAEKISCADNFFDVVFVSLVCCSVQDLHQALSEIKRVLKTDGHFIFLEHVADTQGTQRRKWQDRLNRFWRPIAGNCHLNRETKRHIEEAGFNIFEIKYENMCTPMSLVRPTIRGRAKPTAPTQWAPKQA